MNEVRIEPARALRWAPGWVLLVVALWPLHGIATALLAAGALVGLAELALRRFRGGLGLMSGPAWALTGVLFAAYWLPELLSLIGAADWTHGLRKVLSDILVLPLLWLAAASVAVARGRQIVFSGLGLIALVWTVDALVAAGTGTSPLFWLLDRGRLALLGQPLCLPQEVDAPGRLAGVFGPCNPKLGIVLASLSPFALETAGRRAGGIGWWLAALAIGVVVLLAGARAAWLTYALVLLWSGWRALGRRGLLALLAVMLLGMGALAAWSPLVQERVQRSAQALDGGMAALDAALSGRLRIWSGALCMLREHPLNGVGVRGFRAAFPACDPHPERVPAWGAGPPLHAHQLVLEVASETGLVGLLLWLAGAALAWRAWRYADRAARARAHPAMLALAVSVFPLNTHLAAYSTFWGGVLLLLAGLYVGSLWGPVEPEASAPQR
ncbi:MAG: O-antigen ligase family protein [Pseudomonadota bacterium]